jgi:hypothetical protein
MGSTLQLCWEQSPILLGVQRGDSLIKPRQSQNRISGFNTESVLKPLILFCDWRGLIKESPR